MLALKFEKKNNYIVGIMNINEHKRKIHNRVNYYVNRPYSTCACY